MVAVIESILNRLSAWIDLLQQSYDNNLEVLTVSKELQVLAGL